MITVAESLALLTGAHPSLEEARAVLEAEWRPDEPPPTILSSGLAKALVAVAEMAPESDLSSVFSCVERILSSGNDLAKDVIATGFLEAVVTAADNKNSGGLRLIKLFGPLASSYCNEWKSFTE